MTRLWNKIAFRLGLTGERSERFVTLARLAVFWERLWPALWPASGILGLFVAAALFDLFADIPSLVHALVLFVAVMAAAAFLDRNLKTLRFPRWEEGARRVERDSTLAHRPITEGHDRLAVGAGDPWTEEIWLNHIRRLLARITDLRLRLPRPGLQSRDRYELRFAVLLLVLAGLVVAGPEWSKRLSAAFTPDTGPAQSSASLEAWINPPAYTGEAPLYVQRSDADAGPLAVPRGSELVLRVHGAHSVPDLAMDPLPADGPLRFKGTDGEYGVDAPLWQDGNLRVLADGRLLAKLDIHAIADTPPVVAFTELPSRTEHDAIKFAFRAADDYGVVSVRAIIRPVRKAARAVLSVDLPLAAPSAKTLTDTVFRDLTGEPLAGTMVEIVLEAKDGAGQTGRSRPAQMILPARVFTNPLARALIEQRQNLAMDAPHARATALLALDALSLAPDRFYQGQNNIYLAIRAAYWGLTAAHAPADIARVEELLWDTAVALEQGGLLAAADELRRIQQQLSQALEQGAPQDVIDALLDRYRQALSRYLQSLAQSAPKDNGSLAQNGRTITPGDLDALLKAIEQMAQTGSRADAAQALAMLQNLLENLHVASGTGSGSGDKTLSDAIAGLGDLIGRQRQLLDKSFREAQGAGDPKDGGGKGLAEQQRRLHDDLDKVEKGLGENKEGAPHSLGDAERDMDNAERALGSNAFDSAGQAQKDALQALRDSVGKLADSLMQQNGQGQNSQNDPLGREEGSSGFAAGSGVKIPDRDALARARSILEELRRRAAERGRPKEELDYYDRLLKEF